MTNKSKLAVVGLISLDRVYLPKSHYPANRVKKISEVDENGIMGFFEVLGGAAGRAALTAKHLNNKNHEVDVKLFGTVGRQTSPYQELIGEIDREELGDDICVYYDQPCQNSVAVINDDGDVQSVSRFGQPQYSDRPEELELLRETVDNADVVFADATDPYLTEAALDEAPKTALSVLGVGDYYNFPEEQFERFDYVTMSSRYFLYKLNAINSRKPSKSRKIDVDENLGLPERLTSDFCEIEAEFFKKFKPTATIVITNGSGKGQYISLRGFDSAEDPTKFILDNTHDWSPSPIAVLNARDAYGAGDAFNGAFAWTLAQGITDVKACIEIANAVASQFVTRCGNVGLTTINQVNIPLNGEAFMQAIHSEL